MCGRAIYSITNIGMQNSSFMFFKCVCTVAVFSLALLQVTINVQQLRYAVFSNYFKFYEPQLLEQRFNELCTATVDLATNLVQMFLNCCQ